MVKYNATSIIVNKLRQIMMNLLINGLGLKWFITNITGIVQFKHLLLGIRFYHKRYRYYQGWNLSYINCILFFNMLDIRFYSPTSPSRVAPHGITRETNSHIGSTLYPGANANLLRTRSVGIQSNGANANLFKSPVSIQSLEPTPIFSKP